MNINFGVIFWIYFGGSIIILLVILLIIDFNKLNFDKYFRGQL